MVTVDAGNARLAHVIGQRFRPELRAAVAQAQLELADQRVEAAEVANQHIDNYVLPSVLAASVLFFSGMGVKFEGRWIKVALNACVALLFVGTAVVATTFPAT